METTENNKLIAEFMGFEKSIIGDGQGGQYDYDLPDWVEMITENDLHYCSDCGNSLHSTDHVFAYELKFHTSWDWLMPVVEKISSVESYGMTRETMKNIGLSIPEIDLVYHYVLEFIKWYNKNKNL